MDGVGVTVTCIGGILVYAGVKGLSLPDVIRNVITGEPIGVNVGNVPLGSTPRDPNATTPGTVGEDGDDHKAVGMALASQYGWMSGPEWNALVDLWNRESGWNNHAENPTSHAYGIPQALPYTKMPKAAWPESAGGTSDVTAQIQWGLIYIKSRYGTPSKALEHWLTNRWY
jgi:hypothetical protein